VPALVRFAYKQKMPRGLAQPEAMAGADGSPTVLVFCHDSPSAVKSGVTGFCVVCGGQHVQRGTCQ